MVLQAYDFYVLNRDYDCDLQMGGQDQWGNIVAGIDLTRRISQNEVYGITFPLIIDSNGEKFGKSVKGAVWLDAGKTPPYEYYQFFRNTMDADVRRYLSLFTFLPIDEIRALAKLKPPLLNRAKEILAFEATKITHGEEEAQRAYRASVEKFGESDPRGEVETSSSIAWADTSGSVHPSVEVSEEMLSGEFTVVDAFVHAGLCKSRGEARRLIAQGGAYIEGRRVEEESERICREDFKDSGLDLRAGKKRHMKLVLR
jgi:tyrosyl-tRNA synthetase